MVEDYHTNQHSNTGPANEDFRLTVINTGGYKPLPPIPQPQRKISTVSSGDPEGREDVWRRASLGNFVRTIAELQILDADKFQAVLNRYLMEK